MENINLSKNWYNIERICVGCKEIVPVGRRVCPHCFSNSVKIRFIN